MMNWTEFIVVTLLNLAGYLSALMLGISLGEKHIIRQVNRTLDQSGILTTLPSATTPTDTTTTEPWKKI